MEQEIKDKELKRIVTNFTKGILGKRESKLMCFAVCSPLQSYLSVFGIQVELVEGEIETDIRTVGHFWLKYKDKIIDPTADQFNDQIMYIDSPMPRIYIGEKPKHYKEIVNV